MSKIKKTLTALKKWFYEFRYGHPFLLNEEVDIIIETRADKAYKWMTDYEIQLLIKSSVKIMYAKKYPNAKRYSLANSNTNRK